jgi:hypothetical protein
MGLSYPIKDKISLINLIALLMILEFCCFAQKQGILFKIAILHNIKLKNILIGELDLT